MAMLAVAVNEGPAGPEVANAACTAEDKGT